MTNIAAGVEGSNPLLNVGIFALFVIITLVIVFRASRNTKTASDYYAAGRAFTGPQNGIAISGDYLSAASFLGIAGAIAINGYASGRTRSRTPRARRTRRPRCWPSNWAVRCCSGSSRRSR